MRQFRTQAIILRRTNYGEADRILNLLTPDHGKQSAIAKGVRRPKSKLAGGLELFAVCDVTILQGKSDMGVITSSRIKVFYGDILRDYDRMQVAYEVIKQINKATETVTDPAFYALLHDSLLYLGDLKIDWRITELWFGLQLANVLGSGINLLTDRDDKPLAEDKKYGFDSQLGVFYASDRGVFDADHIKLLRVALVKTPIVLSRLGGLEKLDWSRLREVIGKY